MNTPLYDYGMIGLGVMGRNLLLNMADHGFAVAGYDRDQPKVAALSAEAGDRKIYAASTLANFVEQLRGPRAILMLVPAGPIVDAVIAEIQPLLNAGDLLVDCGNSHFKDTQRRSEALHAAGLHFMGVGVSGGEAGARRGPSIMPGGDANLYQRLAPMLEAIAAKVNGEACVAHLGNGAAGHYVKMVHNGIEYALMQLLAESYHLLKTAGQFNNAELAELFSTWNQGRVQSFLVEITAEIFRHKDDHSDQDLIDVILDSARQKGTGTWTSDEALQLQVPIPLIDTAVMMRYLSALKPQRLAAAQILTGPQEAEPFPKNMLAKVLEDAFFFAMIITYAQGLALLHAASQAYQYALNLEQVASIWRGGCIIRAALLEDIRLAYRDQPELPNLLLHPNIAQLLNDSHASLRSILQLGIMTGVPLPGFYAALGYFDSYRQGRLPANLIQAQRDYFGAHTYERLDQPGTFHTQWNA